MNHFLVESRDEATLRTELCGLPDLTYRRGPDSALKRLWVFVRIRVYQVQSYGQPPIIPRLICDVEVQNQTLYTVGLMVTSFKESMKRDIVSGANTMFALLDGNWHQSLDGRTDVKKKKFTS